MTDFLGYSGTMSELLKFSENFVPKTYEQALACQDKEKWRTSISAEFQNMAKHNVFKLVDRPGNIQNVIRSKLLFKVKMDGRNKTRLVAMGFSQKEGVDYKEVFAPTVREHR